MNVSKFLLLLLIIPALTGCKKDNATLLTAHIWKFDKMTTSSTDQTLQTLVAFFSALLVNSTLNFSEDGTYVMASPLSENPETGTWDLSDDGKTLTMDGDPMAVVTLTDEQLVLEGEEVDDEYGAYTVKLYWKK